MSFQTSNHGFPELGEDEEDLDLPDPDRPWEEEIEEIDPSWEDFIGEDRDLEVEDDHWFDEPDMGYHWDDY